MNLFILTLIAIIGGILLGVISVKNGKYLWVWLAYLVGVVQAILISQLN